MELVEAKLPEKILNMKEPIILTNHLIIILVIENKCKYYSNLTFLQLKTSIMPGALVSLRPSLLLFAYPWVLQDSVWFWPWEKRRRNEQWLKGELRNGVRSKKARACNHKQMIASLCFRYNSGTGFQPRQEATRNNYDYVDPNTTEVKKSSSHSSLNVKS